MHRDTPLLELQNTKKPDGTKHNCGHAQLGQILDQKIKERQKTQLPFLKSWERKNWVSGVKAGYRACPPALNTTKGWADHLSHPSSLTPGHTPPSSSIRNEPPSASEETCHLFSLPPAASSGAPIKPGLNFLSGLKSISPDWGRLRTLVGIKSSRAGLRYTDEHTEQGEDSDLFPLWIRSSCPALRPCQGPMFQECLTPSCSLPLHFSGI